MEVHTTVDEFRKVLDSERSTGGRIGFVPTMGALHAGHLSLVDRARIDSDVVAMSVFVNPLQFGVNEDLNRYPRSFEDDCAKATTAGVAHLFSPSVGEMYGSGTPLTTVHIAELTGRFEGELRPGHFDGVATAVAKLLSIAGACRAYFGEKDWQQLEVVRQLVADLSMAVEVVGCPIVREADGLAMSSRNVFLDPAQRHAALRLRGALTAGVSAFHSGVIDPSALSGLMIAKMSVDSFVSPDYAGCVRKHMRTPDVVSAGDRLLVAATVGSTRLIDNMGVV